MTMAMIMVEEGPLARVTIVEANDCESGEIRPTGTVAEQSRASADCDQAGESSVQIFYYFEKELTVTKCWQ